MVRVVVMEQVGVYEWDESIERRMVIFSVNIYRLKYKKTLFGKSQ